MSWYYTENNQQRGPVTETEFDNLVQAGKITAATLVWCEGMAAWQPYREVMPPPDGPVPPPLTDPPGLSATASGLAPQRDGPPWEHRATLGFFNATLETFKGVLFDPVETFTRMQREGGIANPFLYALMLGGIGGYAAAVYYVISHQGATTFGTQAYGSNFNLVTAYGTGTVLIGALFFIPIVLFLSTFVRAGIFHICLMMLGAATQPFETTYRVVCYSFGSAAVFQLIPMCGGLIAFVWDLVNTCIGLSKTHEISTGKAAAAVLLPMLCCCGCFAAVIVFTVAAAQRH